MVFIIIVVFVVFVIVVDVDVVFFRRYASSSKKQLVESQLARKLTLVLSQQEKIKVVRHYVSRRKTGYLLGKKGLAMTMGIDNLDSA